MNIKKKRAALLKYVSLVLFFILIISGFLSFVSLGIFAQEDQSPQAAPLSKSFLEFLKGQEMRKWKNISDDGHPLGLVPSPREVLPFHVLPQVKIDGLPSSFDLRDWEKLPPVRDQGNCGSCWAFASFGSLESFLRPIEKWNFSEQHLIDHHDFDWEPCDGGNIDMTTAYLARWSGPITEQDVPYIYSRPYDFAPLGLNVRKHVQNIIYLPPRKNSLDNDLIKQAIMSYGAVYTSMFFASKAYNPSSKAFYNPDKKKGAHAVAIVGWDDNFDKNKFNELPPGNGAFIARNSWGWNWGESGYFYVSYYDAYFARRYYNAVITAETKNNYKRIYQYDPLGATWDLGWGNSNTGWFSNIFTSVARDSVIAVSFYSFGTSADYEVYIYSGVSPNNPRLGTLKLKQTGSLSHPGYYTIKLKKSVSLRAGERFSVVVKLKTNNYNWPIAYEYPFKNYSSRAKAQAGESFISPNGKNWYDLHTAWDGEFANSNVCLKAFTGYPPLYPPKNFAIQRLVNDLIFFKEYVNRLTWEENPQNKTTIVSYRLYRKAKGDPDINYQLLEEISPNIFVFDDRGLKEEELYSYRITSADEYGRESDPGEISN